MCVYAHTCLCICVCARALCVCVCVHTSVCGRACVPHARTHVCACVYERERERERERELMYGDDVHVSDQLKLSVVLNLCHCQCTNDQCLNWIISGDDKC